METTILSQKNCHRAAAVREIGKPDAPALEFKRENEKRGTESAEMAFDGGTLVKNFAEDRLQILFDAKPDADTIAKLTKNGFRWSPRFKAWQRQLTQNAYYACARVIPVTVEQIKEF